MKRKITVEDLDALREQLLDAHADIHTKELMAIEFLKERVRASSKRKGFEPQRSPSRAGLRTQRKGPEGGRRSAPSLPGEPQKVDAVVLRPPERVQSWAEKPAEEPGEADVQDPAGRVAPSEQEKKWREFRESIPVKKED